MMQSADRLWRYSAFAVPALVPLAVRLELTQPVLVQSLFIAVATAAILYVQRKIDFRVFDELKRADHTLRSVGLVQDFETSDLGWFWETDRRGRLCYITSRVAERIGKPPQELIGTPLLDLFVTGSAQIDEREERTLGFHLSSRIAFAELSIKVAADEERWWSVSGNPVLDDYGNFQGFRGSGTDLTNARESQDAMRLLAQYDPLTGLANRVEINRALEKSLTGHLGHPQACALFLLDLDRFKQVNDTLGHPAGDAMLEQVAKRLIRVVGKAGKVGRIGGDEFQIVLPKLVTEADLKPIADEIIETLSVPYRIDGGQVRIGASIGIAIYESGPADPSALVRSADLALYAAKDAGRGTSRFYEPAMHEQASERRVLEEDLREALNRDELFLVYQPVVDVATEKISGFEVLTRWQHPTKGMISPELFIGIAEEIGIISQIGEWTIRSACDQLALWPGRLRMAVNVSPVQFASGGLTGVVMSAIASSGIYPSQLELEITESVFIDESDHNVAIFGQLKKAGVRLALDDFGTGYSALGYLKKAPFDRIKIDQSFVRGAVKKDSMNAAIIASIVSLAEALGMDTTAEGAETHDELDLIRSLGCSHVQGYIYGKPVSAEEAGALLEIKGGHVAPAGHKAHREQRRRTFRKVGVHNDGYCYEGLIRNISPQGAMVDGLWDVPKGTRFDLELDTGVFVEATARWSHGNRMGLEFDKSVDLEHIGGGNSQPFALETGWRDLAVAS